MKAILVPSGDQARGQAHTRVSPPARAANEIGLLPSALITRISGVPSISWTYASFLLSGDQAGQQCHSSSLVNCVRPLPSASITEISLKLLAPWDTKASLLLSGDQAIVRSHPLLMVRLIVLLPSAFITHISLSIPSWKKAILVPSGDQAGP